MMLNFVTHGTATDKPPLFILHGLFGSARNWGVIGKRLSADRRVIAVDLRNHGDSPWHDLHDYPAMAADVADLLRAEAGGAADLLGHSMGGKVAMVLGLTAPDLIRRLVIADIAPVSYGHSQMQFVDAMRRIDPATTLSRDAAQAAMPDVAPDVAPFLLQSLDLRAGRWKLNLDALATHMPRIVGFPDMQGQFTEPALFLTGGRSDYVRPEHRDRIKALFPKARFASLPDAGHWLHAEAPRDFEATVRVFLDA